MMNTVRAIVREGKVELLEPVELPEGTEALVTLLTESDTAFWTQASAPAAGRIWNTAEDDVYAELLQK